MKRCPTCNRVEADDTLAFCRTDGVALVNDSGSVGGETQTAQFGSGPVSSESETSLLPHTSTSPEINRSTGPTTALPASQIQGTTRELTKPKRRAFAFATIGAALVIIFALGYFFLSRSRTTAIESIAVMPFVNESGNADVEYLSDGMTETLISSLSQLPNLNVKARSSVFRYKGKEVDPKGIAAELSVQAFLNGRVAQRGDQLTLTLELVDAQTENVIWSQQYNRKQTDLVSLQSDIARDVSNKLKSKLSGVDGQHVVRNGTAITEAYQLYLKGRYHYNKFTDEGYRKGIEYFKQATAMDPNYAQAYSGLADCYFGLSDQFEPPNDVMPKARVAAEKALALDDSLAEAHASLGLVKMFYDLKWAEAEGEFQRAIALNPNYANAHLFYSRLLVSAGRYDEAVSESELSTQIEPLSPVNSAYLGYVLVFAGRSDAAVGQLKKALELDNNYAITHYYLGSVYQKLGQFDKAITEYETALQLNHNPRFMMALGNVYAAAGQREKAFRVLADLTEMKKEQYVSSYYLAAVYTGLNNKDQAFGLLDKAFDEHADSLAGLKISVLLDNLRQDPRYTEMLKRLNLPE